MPLDIVDSSALSHPVQEPVKEKPSSRDAAGWAGEAGIHGVLRCCQREGGSLQGPREEVSGMSHGQVDSLFRNETDRTF